MKTKIGTITNIEKSFGLFESTILWASSEEALEHFVA